MSAISASALAGYGAIASAKIEATSTRETSTEKSAVQAAATPSAIYSSPFIYIDPSSNRVVFETRDSETGKLTDQFPSSSQLHAYRLQQSVADQSTGSGASIAGIGSVQLTAKPLAASGKSDIAA